MEEGHFWCSIARLRGSRNGVPARRWLVDSSSETKSQETRMAYCELRYSRILLVINFWTLPAQTFWLLSVCRSYFAHGYPGSSFSSHPPLPLDKMHVSKVLVWGGQLSDKHFSASDHGLIVRMVAGLQLMRRSASFRGPRTGSRRVSSPTSSMSVSGRQGNIYRYAPSTIPPHTEYTRENAFEPVHYHTTRAEDVQLMFHRTHALIALAVESPATGACRERLLLRPGWPERSG